MSRTGEHMSKDKLGSLLAERVDLKTLISQFNKEIANTKKQIDVIDEQLTGFLTESGLDAIKKDGYTVKLAEKVGLKVENWDDVWDFIITNNRRELLRKQLIQAALEEMYEAEETMPGAELYTYSQLDVKKTG
jgi:hypothetical protein